MFVTCQPINKPKKKKETTAEVILVKPPRPRLYEVLRGDCSRHNKIGIYVPNERSRYGLGQRLLLLLIRNFKWRIRNAPLRHSNIPHGDLSKCSDAIRTNKCTNTKQLPLNSERNNANSRHRDTRVSLPHDRNKKDSI